MPKVLTTIGVVSSNIPDYIKETFIDLFEIIPPTFTLNGSKENSWSCLTTITVNALKEPCAPVPNVDFNWTSFIPVIIEDVAFCLQ